MVNCYLAIILGRCFKTIREMAKEKNKITINTFRATQSMLPPIPSPRIVHIDEGSPLRKPDNIPEEPLIPPPPKFTITENIQKIISDLKKQHQDKGKKHVSEPHSPERTYKKFKGWSQA